MDIQLLLEYQRRCTLQKFQLMLNHLKGKRQTQPYKGKIMPKWFVCTISVIILFTTPFPVNGRVHFGNILCFPF